jgi:hypothetical protein
VKLASIMLYAHKENFPAMIMPKAALPEYQGISSKGSADFSNILQ